jgi:hypothetical protein
VRTAWIYGGRAAEPQVPDADVDLMVLLENNGPPRRCAGVLPDGTEVHANVIGAASLAHHDSVFNGGFYFTGKLLGPRSLLLGNREESSALLGRANGYLRHWAQLILPRSAEGPWEPSSELARMYLLMIAITPVYAIYFAQWWHKRWFSDLWKETLGVLKPDTPDPCPLPGWIRTPAEKGLRRRILLGYLSAAWWHTDLRIRFPDDDHVDAFFTQAHHRMATMAGGTVQAALRFLVTEAGLEPLTVASILGVPEDQISPEKALSTDALTLKAGT